MADRVTAVGQSFFDPLPAGADLYLLKNVLADWPDREAMALLSRCAEAARPAGRVVVLGGVSPDGDSGPSPELLMLVLVGGKDRGLSEFRELARAAGLEVHGRRATTVGPLCRRVPSDVLTLERPGRFRDSGYARQEKPRARGTFSTKLAGVPHSDSVTLMRHWRRAMYILLRKTQAPPPSSRLLGRR